MTTAAAIVDSIYGIDYEWYHPDTRTKLERTATEMLACGIPPADVAYFMASVVEVIENEYGE